MSDPQKYRTREEVEEYKRQDPILILEDLMKKEGAWNDAKAAKQDEEAAAVVAESVAFAEASPEPALHTLYEDIYAEAPFFMHPGAGGNSGSSAGSSDGSKPTIGTSTGTRS